MHYSTIVYPKYKYFGRCFVENTKLHFPTFLLYLERNYNKTSLLKTIYISPVCFYVIHIHLIEVKEIFVKVDKFIYTV